MESASATSRRKVTDSLNHWQMLVDALKDEDRLLRKRLANCPRHLREARGPDGALSFKETLGHIAYWDSFTVEFFTARLSVGLIDPAPPVDFERLSHQALSEMRDLPFGEVLARYLESTGALVEFLKENWKKLSKRERQNFWVPLKHRRHHRITLFRSLDGMGAVEAQGVEGEEEMAAGA